VEPLIEMVSRQIYRSLKEIEFYKFRCKNLNATDNLDVIKLGETNIKVLLTPGHTVGSVSYLLQDSLFTGDTIFIEGCGMCNTNGGNPVQMFESIQMIKKMIDPSVRIYPAHSYGKEPGYPLSNLMQENIYFLIDREDLFVEFRMRSNQNDIFKFQ